MPEIFAVVADPVRRVLISRLHGSEPLALSELAEGLSISRQAVTKHLNQLEKAGLVRSERKGRQRLHSLDAQPLAEIEAWLAPYSAAWDRRLARLKNHLDGPSTGGQAVSSAPSETDEQEKEP